MLKLTTLSKRPSLFRWLEKFVSQYPLSRHEPGQSLSADRLQRYGVRSIWRGDARCTQPIAFMIKSRRKFANRAGECECVGLTPFSFLNYPGDTAARELVRQGEKEGVDVAINF